MAEELWEKQHKEWIKNVIIKRPSDAPDVADESAEDLWKRVSGMVGTFYGEGCHDGMVAEAPKEVITVPVRFQCQQCHMSFASKSAHTAHARSHARAATPRQEGGAGELAPGAAAADPYRCDVCCKTFAVPARLVRHYRTHTGERPFECEFCHKMFSVKENLQVHRRIHTKERPYRCQVCGRAFEHSGKLHRHMRIHTGERPHACSVCGKTFIQSGQLVIHLRTHTGEKPYRCAAPNCGKGFTCSKQLKVHSRTHTGEKPYHCDICFRDFGYNHVLKLHRVQHYGSKCYKCTICDDTFKSKKEMEAHIKGHADEMPDRKVAEREVRLEAAVPVEIEFIRAKPSYSLADVCQSPRKPARQTSPTDFPSPHHSATRYAATVLVARERDSAEAFLPEYLRSSSSDVSVELRVPSQGSYAAPIAGIPPSPPPQAADKYCYEPLTIIHHGYFVPQPIPDYRPALETNSNIVRCVEAALAVAEDASSPTPPSSTPERSSSPEDAMALDFVSYKEMSNLPLRKRKVYMKQIQTPPVRLNSVIQFAKAS